MTHLSAFVLGMLIGAVVLVAGFIVQDFADKRRERKRRRWLAGA